jgi:hypothetical protein
VTVADVGSREAIREQAAQRFAQLGWPAAKSEEWKYTSLAELSRRDFRLENRAPERADAHGASLCGRAIAELVFINGRYAPEMWRRRGPMSGSPSTSPGTPTTRTTR